MTESVLNSRLVQRAKRLGFVGVMETFTHRGFRCFEMFPFNPNDMKDDEVAHVGYPQLLLVRGSSIRVASQEFIQSYLDALGDMSDEEADSIMDGHPFMS